MATLSTTSESIFNDGKPGPLTAARLRRTRLAYIAMCALGLLLLLAGSPGWQAFGVGLWFPGGGFLAAGGWWMLLFPLTLVLFALALFCWLGAGMVVAPPLVWLGAAALAGAAAGMSIWLPGPVVVALVAIGWHLHGRGKRGARLAQQLQRRDQRRAYVPQLMAELAARAAPVPAAGTREMNPEQLAALRYCIDRSLQPAGDWTHYNVIDQFQPAALRYQLNNLGYAIGLAQCHYTPNFHGYMSEAQRGAIDKYLRREVWKYWRLERLWGSFSTRFDPAGVDNIMLTGFFGINVGLYEGNTGDDRYSKPNGLPFKWDDSLTFQHDFHSIARSIADNMDRTDLSLYPCEPNWVYTPCNFRGLTSLALHDRIHGTRLLAERLPRFMENLNGEFTLPDGGILTVMSSHTGMAVPMPFGEASRALMMNVFDREHARFAWTLAHHDTVKHDDGRVEIVLHGRGIDFGNYAKGHAATLAGIIAAAAEMGDGQARQAAIDRLNDLYPPKIEDGVAFYPCSNGTRAFIAQALIAGRDDWRNAMLQGPEPAALSGPLLAAVPYPDVLVAKAVSRGEDLELVLHPGAAAGTFTLMLERLRPNGSYRIEGGDQPAALVADGEGRAQLTAPVHGRTALHIVPA